MDWSAQRRSRSDSRWELGLRRDSSLSTREKDEEQNGHGTRMLEPFSILALFRGGPESSVHVESWNSQVFSRTGSSTTKW